MTVNNPGNIRYNEARGSIPGLSGQQRGFNTYESPSAGFEDMSKLLSLYQREHGLNTISGIINRWAPPTENDTSNYVQFVADQMNLQSDEELNLDDPETMKALMKAMTRMEKGNEEAERLFQEAGLDREEVNKSELRVPQEAPQESGVPKDFNPEKDQIIEDQFGNRYIFSKDTSDTEIRQNIKEYLVDTGQLDPQGGVPSAIGSAFTDRLVGRYNAVKELVTGEGAKETILAQRREQTRGFKELSDLTDDEGFLKNTWDGLTLVAEQLGLQADRILGGAVGAGVVAGAGRALSFVPHPAAKGIGALIGASVPFFFADNIGRQIAESEDPLKPDLDPKAAFLAAGAQTVPEVILGSELLPLRGIIKFPILGSNEAKRHTFNRMGKVLGLTAFGGGTEAWQQMLERASVPGLRIDSEEAYKEYIDAAIIGSLVTGTISPFSVYLGNRRSGGPQRKGDDLESHEEDAPGEPLGLPAPPLQIEYKPGDPIDVPPGGFHKHYGRIQGPTPPLAINDRSTQIDVPPGGFHRQPGPVEPPIINYEEMGPDSYQVLEDVIPEAKFKSPRAAIGFLRDRGVDLRALFNTPRDPDFMGDIDKLGPIDKSKAIGLAEAIATAEQGVRYEPLMGKTDEDTGKIVLPREKFEWDQNKQDLLEWGVPEEYLLFLPKGTAAKLRNDFDPERTLPRDRLKIHDDGFVEPEPIVDPEKFTAPEEFSYALPQEDLKDLRSDQETLLNEMALEEIRHERRTELRQQYGPQKYDEIMDRKERYAAQNRSFLRKYARGLGLSRDDINNATDDQVSEMISRMPNKNREIKQYKDKLRKRQQRIPPEFRDVAPVFRRRTQIFPREVFGETVEYRPFSEGGLSKGARDRWSDVVDAVRETVRRVTGGRVPVQFSEELIAPDGTPVMGAYLGHSIHIALDGNPTRTAWHELFHHLYQNTDFFTDGQRRILEANVKKLRNRFVEKGLSEEDAKYFEDPEEVLAESLGDYAAGEDILFKPVKSIFDKVKEFVEKLGNALKLRGFKSLEDVFSDIFRAEDVATRSSQERFQARRARDYAEKLSEEINERAQPDYDYDAKNFSTKAGQPNLWWHGRRWLSSLPGMAQYDDALAYVTNLASSAEMVKANVMHTLADMTRNYRRSGQWDPIANTAHELLMHLRTTRQPMNFDSSGRLTYERGGKRVRASQELSEAARVITRAYKEGLVQKEHALRRALAASNAGVGHNATFTEVSEALRLGEEALDNFTGPSKAKELLREQVKLLRFAKAGLREFGRAKDESTPYVPQQRHGDWGIKVTNKAGKYIGFYTLPSGLFTDGPTKGDLEKVANRIRSELGSDAVMSDPFVMSYDKISEKIGRMPSLEMIEAMAGAIEPAAQRRFRDFIEQRLAVAEAKKGIRMLDSDNVPGWENNWDAVWSNYVSGAAHSASKFEFGPKWNKFRAAVDDNYGNTRYGNVLNREIDYQLSPELDAAKMRQFNFAWALAANFSTGMLQLTTLATMVPSAMMAYNANPISNLSNLAKNFALSTRVFSSKVSEGSGFTRRENLARIIKDKKLLDSLDKLRNYVQGNVLEEANLDKGATAHSRVGKVMGATSEILNKAGFVMKMTERASRLTTAITMLKDFKSNPEYLRRAEQSLSRDKNYHTFRRMHRDLTPDEAVTAYMIQRTHALFGKPGRGPAQRGPLAQFIFPFMTYAQQMGEFMLQQARGQQGPRGQLGALLGLSLFTMMAGFSGIPGSELWRTIWEGTQNSLFGRATTSSTDLRNGVKEVANEFFDGEVPEEVLNDIAKASDRGLVELATGMSVGRRIGLPLWFEGLVTTLMNPNPDLRSAMGIFGQTLRGAQDIGRGLEEGKGFDPTPVLPAALRNVSKAITYSTHGAKTGYGRQLVGPDELSPSEIFRKALGWEPGLVQERREKNRYVDAIRSGKFAPLKQRYVEQVARKLTEKRRSDDATQRRRLQKDISKLYNDLAEEMRKNNVPLNADFWRSFHKSVNNRVTRALHPERIEKQRLTKAVRRELAKGRIDVYE